MNRYVIKFSKTGYAKYTSHLDLLRLFKRAFKKTGITLRYSQGFNPHPKISFAQPLSLGYASDYELIEIETVEEHKMNDITEKLQREMPDGIAITNCVRLNDDIKSLAGDCRSAEYKIWIPTEESDEFLKKQLKKYLNQDEIIALKRMKKTKKLEPVNIKHQIRFAEISKIGEFAMIHLLCDSGSQSNLSPELVISSFLNSSGIDVDRFEIEVERKKIEFNSNLQF